MHTEGELAINEDRHPVGIILLSRQLGDGTALKRWVGGFAHPRNIDWRAK
jgi:hypothetical protein